MVAAAMPVTSVAIRADKPRIRAAKNEKEAAVTPAKSAVPNKYFREAGTREGRSLIGSIGST
jgi:hypothetical protein